LTTPKGADFEALIEIEFKQHPYRSPVPRRKIGDISVIDVERLA
jgi:hypothetical protein